MILTPSILIKHLVVVAVMVVVVDGCSAAAPETAVAIVIKKPEKTQIKIRLSSFEDGSSKGMLQCIPDIIT